MVTTVVNTVNISPEIYCIAKVKGGKKIEEKRENIYKIHMNYIFLMKRNDLD